MDCNRQASHVDTVEWCAQALYVARTEQDRGSATSGVPSYGRHGSSTASGGGYTTGTTDSSSGGGADYYSYNYAGTYGGSGVGAGAGGAYYHHDGTSSAASASGLDFNEYIQDRFADSFDPIPLDRSLARQAQT